ncbi:hypothetical protein HJFPF1_06276 [Paramyrothecium foliicola]|nr:hypothetical protein HJFPF1_06276 [Paramyrothecium foliicola]
MSKRTVFTTITPLPPGISRDTALSLLHNHLEMIDLNPLIKERHPIDPPAHASPDERECIWYSLTDKISYLPGGVMSGEVTYSCAFHDLPEGLQTHCYAPMGLDIRDKWSVGGSLPGEPKQPVELGLGAPQVGLYIREDIDMRCNIFMAGFVKKTLKKAHATLVEHLSVKAKNISRESSEPPARISFHNEQPRRASATSSRRSSPRSSDSHNTAPQPRGQSPHALVVQNSGARHARSSSAGAPNSRYHMPSQQQMQQPYQEMASWRASNVPTRQGTQYVGPSRPQDYVDFAAMNPYDTNGSPVDPHTQQYRPYSSHSKAPPPLPTKLPPHRHHLAELE